MDKKQQELQEFLDRRNEDMIRALRCLASQGSDGDCYADWFNTLNTDGARMSCSGHQKGTRPCPYFQKNYGTSFADGECSEWLKAVADELEKYRKRI